MCDTEIVRERLSWNHPIEKRFGQREWQSLNSLIGQSFSWLFNTFDASRCLYVCMVLFNLPVDDTVKVITFQKLPT